MWVFHTPQTIQQPHPLFPHDRTRFSAHSVLPSSTNHQIQTFCKKGKLRKAILLLPQEPSPTQRTYELLINCCSNISDALTVHRNLLEDGYGKDPFLATKLIDMYSQLDSIDRARQVFDESSDRSIYVWNSIFRALTLAGHGEDVFDLYREMNDQT